MNNLKLGRWRKVLKNDRCVGSLDYPGCRSVVEYVDYDTRLCEDCEKQYGLNKKYALKKEMA